MRGRFWPASCRGVLIAGWCWRIHARAAVGSIAARGGDNVWTADDEATFLESAPAHLHLPLLLALWTGQRQGDLLRLPWSAYDGSHIRLQPGQDRRACHRSRSVRRSRPRSMPQQTRAADPHQQPATAVDLARLSDVVEHRREKGRHRRRDVSRSARHGGDAARHRRLHRSRDRDHHRALAARRRTRSSTPTICIAMRRSARAQSGSSNEDKTPN